MKVIINEEEKSADELTEEEIEYMFNDDYYSTILNDVLMENAN